jgi:lysyl-tRNA synthetase class I
MSLVEWIRARRVYRLREGEEESAQMSSWELVMVWRIDWPILRLLPQLVMLQTQA